MWIIVINIEACSNKYHGLRGEKTYQKIIKMERDVYQITKNTSLHFKKTTTLHQKFVAFDNFCMLLLITFTSPILKIVPKMKN